MQDNENIDNSDVEVNVTKSKPHVNIEEVKGFTPSLEDEELRNLVLFPNAAESKIVAFIEKAYDNMSYKEVQDDPVKSAEFNNDLENQQKAMMLDTFKSFFVRPNLSNNLQYGDKKLQITNTPLSENSNRALKGDNITIALSTALKDGGAITIPLFHSGFYVTLKPILDDEIAELETKIATREIELGKDTAGIIFSDYSVVVATLIVDFFVSHIAFTSLKVNNILDIKKYIMIQDLNIMAIGLLASTYSNGLPYKISCANSVETNDSNIRKCNSIWNLKVDPKSLLVIDKDQLSTEQKEHLLNKESKSMSEDSVIEYQNSIPANAEHKEVITLMNGRKITLILKASNIQAYVKSGNRTVDKIIEMVERSITDDVNINSKNNLINNRAKLSILSLFAHFFKSIEIEGFGIVTNDNENDINKALNQIAEDDFLYKKVMDAITKYIDTHVMAIVAIPDFVCPHCKKDTQIDSDVNLPESFKNFIAIDPITSFLDLCTIRIEERVTRDLFHTS